MLPSVLTQALKISYQRPFSRCMTPPATTPVCNCSVGVLWKREERIVDAYQSAIITTMCFEGHLFYFRFMLEFQQLASFKFNTWLIIFTMSCVSGKRQASTLPVAQLGGFYCVWGLLLPERWTYSGGPGVWQPALCIECTLRVKLLLPPPWVEALRQLLGFCFFACLSAWWQNNSKLWTDFNEIVRKGMCKGESKQWFANS